MHRAFKLTVAALLILAGCRQGTAPGPAPDYRPGEAGTVDHALCLLGFAAIPLREVATGHHLVEATINARSGAFVLDTGANATVVSAGHAQHFGVSAGAGALGAAIGAGGGGSAARARIEDLRVGGMDIRHDRIVIADLGPLLDALGRMSGGTVYGIIGQDVLKEHRAVIDVSRPMLYMMAADENPAPVPAEQCREGRAAAAKAPQPAQPI